MKSGKRNNRSSDRRIKNRVGRKNKENDIYA